VAGLTTITSVTRTAVPSVADIRSGIAGKVIAERSLREDIARGSLVPGQRLVEAELSERYNVTRNSLRLAIDVLVGDGLVERVLNRGARVRTISTDEAVEIMECRKVLDGLLCAKAAQRATLDDRADLRANVAAMRAAVDEGELVRHSDLIQHHHRLIARSARQDTATMLANRLQAQIVRLQYQLSLRPSRARQSLAELDRVVSAVVDGDSARAEQAGRDHLQGVIDALIAEAAE
jgi:DNA-binding GntR family transcriptional regulator